MVSSQLENQEVVRTAYEQLIRAAVLAPSGDNTQPWRFEVDLEQGSIAIHLDETRDPSPMNAGQRMARIAIGAALENLMQTAAANDLDPQIVVPHPPALVQVQLQHTAGAPVTIDPVLRDRVSNRRLYEGGSISDDVRAILKRESPELEGVRTHWIFDQGPIQDLAALIGRADALMFGEPSMRRAFLDNVRFDAAPDATVADGLSLASLELSRLDRVALRIMSATPNVMLQFTGAFQFFDKHARKLLKSSSGLCLIVAPNDASHTDVTVGRAMECAWLALTAQRLAVQPMMSLMVLLNALENKAYPSDASFGRPARLLCEQFHRQVCDIENGRIAFLMRFGFAGGPSGRTGRRSLEEVLN